MSGPTSPPSGIGERRKARWLFLAGSISFGAMSTWMIGHQVALLSAWSGLVRSPVVRVQVLGTEDEVWGAARHALDEGEPIRLRYVLPGEDQPRTGLFQREASRGWAFAGGSAGHSGSLPTEYSRFLRDCLEHPVEVIAVDDRFVFQWRLPYQSIAATLSATVAFVLAAVLCVHSLVATLVRPTPRPDEAGSAVPSRLMKLAGWSFLCFTFTGVAAGIATELALAFGSESIASNAEWIGAGGGVIGAMFAPTGTKWIQSIVRSSEIQASTR